MPSGRTALTEVATALGCLGFPSLEWALLRRPPIVGVSGSDWMQIDAEMADARSRAVAHTAFANGEAFSSHRAGLDGRVPRRIEWTGGRRPPGDQVIPSDLRIDHVYLVSCKYLSKIVLNTAPSRLFDRLLQPDARHLRSDWFSLVAPLEYEDFVRASESHFNVAPSSKPLTLTPEERSELKRRFREIGSQMPVPLGDPYRSLCRAVSERSAHRWRDSLSARGAKAESLLWRMLRLASGTYFVLGATSADSLRLRIDTPWDWRQSFELRQLDIEPDVAGQPQVRWAAHVRDRLRDCDRTVEGHVEIRWSHGRFAAPPEAKVYLDTPHDQVPGYVALR